MIFYQDRQFVKKDLENRNIMQKKRTFMKKTLLLFCLKNGMNLNNF